MRSQHLTDKPLKFFSQRPAPSSAPLRPLDFYATDPGDATQTAELAVDRGTYWRHVFDSRRTAFDVWSHLCRCVRPLRDRLDGLSASFGHEDCLGSILARFGPPVLHPTLADDPTKLLRLRSAGVSHHILAGLAGTSFEQVWFLLNYLARCHGLPATLRKFPLNAAQFRYRGAREEAISLGLLNPNRVSSLIGTPARPTIDHNFADELLSDYIDGTPMRDLAFRAGRASSSEVSSYLQRAAERRDTRPYVTPKLLRDEHAARVSPQYAPQTLAQLARTPDGLSKALGAPARLARVLTELPALGLAAITRLDHMLWLARRLASPSVPGEDPRQASPAGLQPIAEAYDFVLSSLPSAPGLGLLKASASVMWPLAHEGRYTDDLARESAECVDRLAAAGPRGNHSPVSFAIASLSNARRSATFLIDRAEDAANFSTQLCRVLGKSKSHDAWQNELGSLVRHLLVPAIERALTPPTSPTPTTPTQPTTASAATQEVSK